MSMGLGRCLFIAAAGCLLAAPVVAAEATPHNLVDVKWLDQHRRDPDVLILDASPAPVYAAQHIPGAVSIDAFTYGGREVPVADTERLYQSWGLSRGKRVVLYDQGGTFMATRVFFSLYYHGFAEKDLAILDGGLAKWREAGRPVTSEVPPARPRGSFTIKTIREAARVRLPEFLSASGDPAGHVLLEALDANWHFGGVVAFGRGGHPPNGVLWPSDDLFRPDKTFKSPDELRRMLGYLNVRPDQAVYTYCGGGVAASAPFFALKFLLGYPDVKLYVESELGYLGDERELPFWTYDAPFLMRSAPWLQGWGGQMLRMYVGARFSVVDVRPAEAYAQGHVPYAVNIPGSVFRSHLGRPEALAGVLGASGVDRSLEAVVVSGAGLTPEAALAFVMLEQLGQARVSFLADAIGQWAPSGLVVTKEPTIVGPRKTPRDMAVGPTTYTAAGRGGVIAADAKGPAGLYPRVFVASGGKLPSATPDGTVVHVPYVDLLNADGTPKAASDIWNTLAKAGVPRYAELVCISDDPGEAAVTYVILKLMGYPDVKVLAPGA